MGELLIAFAVGLGGGAVLGGLLGHAYARARAAAAAARLEEQVRQLEPLRGEVDRFREEAGRLRTALAENRKELEHGAEKLAWLERAEAQLKESFEALSSKALRQNADAYLVRTREQAKILFDPLRERLQSLDQQVRTLEEKREGAYKKLELHLGQLQAAYGELRDTTTGLTSALTRSSSARGTWGEIQLRRIVELAGMVEHVHFEEQAGGEQGRPDLLVYLPREGILPVDAKTTLETYRALTEAEGDAARRECLQLHAAAVRGRVRELGVKGYWKNFDHAPEFVVMFLPHDGLLSAAFEGDKDLLEFAFAQKVLLSTPITLLALLKTVAYGWQQQDLAENARQIAEEGKELYERFQVFVKHLAETGRALGKAVDGYNRTVGSLETRLMPSVRRFKEMNVSTGQIERPPELTVEARGVGPRESPEETPGPDRSGPAA